MPDMYCPPSKFLDLPPLMLTVAICEPEVAKLFSCDFAKLLPRFHSLLASLALKNGQPSGAVFFQLSHYKTHVGIEYRLTIYVMHP